MCRISNIFPAYLRAAPENRFSPAAFSPTLKHKSFSGKSFFAATACCPESAT